MKTLFMRALVVMSTRGRTGTNTIHRFCLSSIRGATMGMGTFGRGTMGAFEPLRRKVSFSLSVCV